MKRLILGDPHGRFDPIINTYNKEQPDEVIILGDYFDSFNIDTYAQRECYDNIINLRNEHLSKKKGRFIMLIGNHDMHYMDEKFGRCSGWNPLTYYQAGYPLCRDWNNEILKIIFVDKVNKTIYSHAGVSMNWFDTWIKSQNLEDINAIQVIAFNFTYKDGGDWYGSSKWNSPLWIRPEGLKKCPYHDKEGIMWNQIFGHTEPDTPIYWKDNDAEFYGIDCINKAYIVEELDDIGKLISRKVIYNEEY